jgi:hypothetical protein
VTLGRKFYKLFSNRKQQQPQLLPHFLPYSISRLKLLEI